MNPDSQKSTGGWVVVAQVAIWSTLSTRSRVHAPRGFKDGKAYTPNEKRKKKSNTMVNSWIPVNRVFERFVWEWTNISFNKTPCILLLKVRELEYVVNLPLLLCFSPCSRGVEPVHCVYRWRLPQGQRTSLPVLWFLFQAPLMMF